MIAFTTAELYALIAAVLYPLARVLAFMSIAPLFNNNAVPMRIRLLIGVAITIGIAPLVPPIPAIEPSSAPGLLMLAREMLIGFSMGFAMRIVFAAISMAGEQIGMQMGLGFAVSYDPLNTSQTPVMAEFLALITTLIFLSINGHLMMVATLAQGFQVLPISLDGLPPTAWLNIVLHGKVIFATGMLLALPVTGAMIITNLSLGVLNRAAPQLNLFAIGFPVTIAGGFVILLLTLNHLVPPLQRLFEAGLQMMLAFPG
ncbi:MAG TPA: flagellar biosynthetic protein FliR [Rhodocyclaceae bacterium]